MRRPFVLGELVVVLAGALRNDRVENKKVVDAFDGAGAKSYNGEKTYR